MAKITVALGLPLLAVGLVGLAPLQAEASGAPAVPSTFSFAGSGWGHGIGLSQYGALGMASEGRSATEILQHYYTGATVGAYGDAVNIGVNLRHRVSSVKVRTEALAAGGGAISANLGAATVFGAAGDVLGLAVSGANVQVTKNGANAGAPSASVVLKWSGTRDPVTTAGDDTKAAVLNVASPTGSFTSAGHRYRYGYVKVIARTVAGVTRLEVVNVLSLHDEYLRGLGEMPSSWPAAALQAQAVAARSFALVKYAAGMRADCQCHVDSGTSDQNFVGYAKETSAYGASWANAVTATNVTGTTSRTVLYRGAPAQAFYSSSTGGRTQNVKDVWGGDLPYLKSVDDHWSTEVKYNPTFAAWGPRVRTQQQAAAAFGLPNVASVDLSARYGSGALRTATARSTSGATKTLSAGTFVSRLALTSNWVRLVGPQATAAAPSIRAFPLATKGKAKAKYFGNRAAHPAMAKSRVVNGGGAGKKHTADVRRVQKWLVKLGYLKAAPNGYFGPSTHTAVKKFQKSKKLKASGLVGGGKNNKKGTWRALQVAVAKKR